MNKLYVKLMATNIKNGKRFYLPYILAGILIVMLFYNMMAIYYNEGLSHMSGGSDIKMIIMKRRKKDIGIYNILGMEKRHIAMELFVETVTIAVTVIACGLITGIVFDKFLMMFLCKILEFETSIKW